MSINKQSYENLLENLRVGNSIAEKDLLLEAARVETPVFLGVLNDDYDIILGRKGAGKTAIFRLIGSMSPFLLGKNIVVLSGVNSTGESIFTQYKEKFKEFSQEEFENFWKLYILSLIYNQFIKDPFFSDKLTAFEKEIGDFKNECSKAGVPNIPAQLSREQILEWVMNLFRNIKGIKKVKLPLAVTVPNQATIFSASPEIEFKSKEMDQLEQQAIYVHNIGKALANLLKNSGFKLWIILDRLDEVFQRYSKIEFCGLRGLLLAYKSFDIDESSDIFRIKLFLRDDIKSFLTDSTIYKKHFKNEIPALPAATHIFAKESPTLSWNEDEIQQLILNRLILNNKLIRDYLGITDKYSMTNPSKLDEVLKNELRDKHVRLEYWNKIFPKKISSSDSLKWIFTRLKDSNDVVTPRSVIDMLEGAISYLKRKIQTNFEDSVTIFPVDSIIEGLKTASKYKLEKDVYNEFPKEQEAIKKLSSFGKYKLKGKDLEKLFGNKWREIVEDLKRIGIIKYIIYSKEYSIAYIFRPAMGISYKNYTG
ncbi:MAG TPA: hypothetical protein VLB73_02770 [Patescibacteria group bacterium]|nr:hypothetical protein [Patescibacteria group bacterium]